MFGLVSSVAPAGATMALGAAAQQASTYFASAALPASHVAARFLSKSLEGGLTLSSRNGDRDSRAAVNNGNTNNGGLRAACDLAAEMAFEPFARRLADAETASTLPPRKLRVLHISSPRPVGALSASLVLRHHHTGAASLAASPLQPAPRASPPTSLTCAGTAATYSAASAGAPALSDLSEHDVHQPQQAPLTSSVLPAAMARWLAKTQPRMKGLSRKLALRHVNRRIIARVARRFTIGIPCLGFYFVSKLIVKDAARVKAEWAAGNTAVASLFASAVLMDALDLAAQATIITGIAHGNFGLGLASAAALLVAADKASLATAGLSFACGLGGELLSIKQGAAQAVATPQGAAN